MSPERIQRKRVKGWRMPEGAVYVGRPSKWGNPWPVDRVIFGVPGGWPLLGMTPALAVELYRTWVTQMRNDRRSAFLDELKGKDLACWCPLDQPCHADVLLELANR